MVRQARLAGSVLQRWRETARSRRSAYLSRVVHLYNSSRGEGSPGGAAVLIDGEVRHAVGEARHELAHATRVDVDAHVRAREMTRRGL